MNKIKVVGIIFGIIVLIVGIIVIPSLFSSNFTVISDGSLDSVSDYSKSWYYNRFDQRFLPNLTMPYGNGYLVDSPYAGVINPGKCKIQETLIAGIMSIPANEVLRLYNNRWTIASWISINPATLSQPFKFIYTDSNDLSMSYDPNNNYIELAIVNSYQQEELTVISLKGINISKYNHYAWVQTPTIQQFYINGALVLDKGMIASPIIHTYGNFFVESRGVLQYINFTICEKPWNQSTINAEVDANKS